MIRLLFPAILLIFFVSSCNHNAIEEISAEKKDSISKAQQLHVSDSLKKTNPLIIAPPDSIYTGEYKDKYPTGIVKFHGQFRFGKRHGHWRSFYPDGSQWSEMHYDRGMRSGPSIVYQQKGGPRYEGYYRNDEMDSVWTFYNDKGAIDQRVLYKHGKVVKKL